LSFGPLAVGGFPNLLNIGKVSCPARCELRCIKVVSGEDMGEVEGRRISRHDTLLYRLTASH